MASMAPAIFFAVFIWWLSTGLIFCAGASSERARQRTISGTSLMAIVALVGLYITREDASTGGAYLAFTCALVIWAWHEMTFLFGYITGPRRSPCPSGARGWQRFRYAVEVLIHHELAIAWTLIAVFWISYDADNKLGLYTLLLLWVMRLSAKFNLFLGVPNFSDELLPKRLNYLRSYFATRSISRLLTISILVGAVAAGCLLWQSTHPALLPHETSGFALLGGLAALATLEHLFLVLPVRDTALWQWLVKLRVQQNTRQSQLTAGLPSDPRR